MSDEQDGQERFPVRLAARLSGIAAERIRSRETRHHAAVSPARSCGGGRQYSAADLKRLRLLGRAVASGRRIGDIATLDDAVLTDLLREGTEHDWEAGLMPISSERMATGIIRSLLLDRLDSIRSSDGVGPRIIFATPSGERRDPGLLAPVEGHLGQDPTARAANSRARSGYQCAHDLSPRSSLACRWLQSAAPAAALRSAISPKRFSGILISFRRGITSSAKSFRLAQVSS